MDGNAISGVMGLLIYGKACMLNGDLELAGRLLERSAVEVEKTTSPFMRMIATHHRSELSLFQGNLTKMERLLKEAYRIGTEYHLDEASAFFRICIDAGRLNYEKGNLPAARQFLAAGVRGAERSLIAYDLIDGYCALFDLACLDRDFDKAEQILSSTEFLASHSGFARHLLDRAEAMKARLALHKGDLHTVRLWLEGQGTPMHFAFCETYRARTAVQGLVLLKEYDRAEALLQDLLASAEARHCLREFVHYRAWLARVLYQQGNLNAALRLLQKAVRISAHQNYVRAILDAGEPVMDLLEALQKSIPAFPRNGPPAR
jgi:tetratricopeptide (TPR) repeat protein